MNKLIVMCGIPGSGKSTIARDENGLGKHSIYISRDEIRYSQNVTQETYFDKEKEVFNIFVNTIDAILPVAGDIGWTVIADATHLNSKSRAKLLNKITNADVKIAVFMNTSLETCLERNSKREGLAKVPESAIKNMYHSLEVPKKEEGFNIIYIINEDGKIVEI